MARFWCYDIKVSNASGKYNLKPRRLVISDAAIRNDLARNPELGLDDVVWAALEIQLRYELGDGVRVVAYRFDRRKDVISLDVHSYTFGFVDRRWGGPEEGGWYYDHFTPIRTFHVSKARAERLSSKLYALTKRLNEGEPGLGSVLSRGQYEHRSGVVEETIRPQYC